MKRLLLIAVAALAFGLVPARPASAQAGFVRWLEKLSGPGSFVGPGVELYALCHGPRENFGPGVSEQELRPDRIASEWFVDVNCSHAARDERHLTAGVQFSKLVGDNNLQYDPSVPASEHDSIGATIVLGTADFSVHRAIDVGWSAGVIRFTGAPSGNFSRLMIEPLRATWKPFAMRRVEPKATVAQIRQAYRREWLQIRAVLTVVPGGFDAEDFGAIPGTYKATTEVQASVYLMVDVANFIGL